MASSSWLREMPLPMRVPSGDQVADVVLGFAFVPADEVELALPAAGTLSEDCDALNDLVFDFCHSALPAFALFATIIKEAREDFNR